MDDTPYSRFKRKLASICPNIEGDVIMEVTFNRIFGAGNGPWGKPEVYQALFNSDNWERAHDIFSTNLRANLYAACNTTWRRFFKVALALPFTAYEITRGGVVLLGHEFSRVVIGSTSLVNGAIAFPSVIDFESQSIQLDNDFFEEHLEEIFGQMLGTKRAHEKATQAYERTTRAYTQECERITDVRARPTRACAGEGNEEARQRVEKARQEEASIRMEKLGKRREEAREKMEKQETRKNLGFANFSRWIFPSSCSRIPSNDKSTLRMEFVGTMIKPICGFLSLLLDRNITCGYETPVIDQGLPVTLPDDRSASLSSAADFSVRLNGRVVAVGELKPCPMTRDFTIKSVRRYLKQLFAEMLSHCVSHGILSDGQTAVLVKLYKQKAEALLASDQPFPVPFRYKIVRPQSSQPSMNAATLAFIKDALPQSDEHQDKERISNAELGKKMYDRVKMSREDFTKKENANDQRKIKSAEQRVATLAPQSAFVSLDIEGQFSPLQFGDFFSQVLHLQPKPTAILGKAFGRTLPRECVVKIFDFENAIRAYARQKCFDKDEASRRCYGAYLQEKKIYQTLGESPEFKSCFVKTPFFHCAVFDTGRLLTVGPTICLKHVEVLEKFPAKSSKHKQMAQDQLAIIHSKGIVHGDLDRRNILCTEDSVYIIDFGFSSDGADGSAYWDVQREGDFQMLDEAFSE